MIRLLNHDNPDDILTLDPDMDSTGFNVLFNQQTTKMKTEHWVDYDDVVEYLESFFESLQYDSDTKSSYKIQVEVPGLPCVLLKKTDLNDYLYNVLDKYMDNLNYNNEWPLESKC